jgi:uncharacterized membrane protein
MSTLIDAVLAFLFLHRVVSGGSLRPVLVRMFGERLFQLLFSLASAACLAWLWLGYLQAHTLSQAHPFYHVPDWFYVFQFPLQLIAYLFIVAGLTTRSPAVAGLEATAHEQHIVKGALRITRHPFLWGTCLFSAGHMLVSPNLAAWIFFGTLLFLAFTGTLSIDAKRRRSLGVSWQEFEASTSNIPFVAFIQRRQRLDLSEIRWWRPAIAVTVFATTMFMHQLPSPT